jgi:hypothetical protein
MRAFLVFFPTQIFSDHTQAYLANMPPVSFIILDGASNAKGLFLPHTYISALLSAPTNSKIARIPPSMHQPIPHRKEQSVCSPNVPKSFSRWAGMKKRMTTSALCPSEGASFRGSTRNYLGLTGGLDFRSYRGAWPFCWDGPVFS